LAEAPLALVAKKPLELKAALRPSAEVEVVGSASRGLRSGEGDSALARRIDELQKQISAVALPLAPELPKALALFDAPERMRGLAVCGNGSLDGYQTGAVGAPNTPEFYTRVDYLGMRTLTMQDKARRQRYIRADRVDLYVKFRDCAEAQGVQQSFMLGEMEVQATKSKRSTPAMAIVLTYWGRLRGEIEQLLTCGEDVFSPDHPSYSKFFLLASLVVARLMFLEHTMRFFVTETEFNWGTVWRYMRAYGRRTTCTECIWSQGAV
jgi:hypothetical protein